MTPSDAALLADVDHFLSSCGSSIELRIIIDSHEAESTNCSAVPKLRRRGRPQSRDDAATRRELEKKKDRERRAEYRRQRLKERDALLEQVKQLTTKLAQLQQAKKSEVPIATAAWKLLARRLKHERLDAEAHHRRLRAQVDARATMIRDLYCRLACDSNSILAEAHCQRKRLRLDHLDVETFETYLNELDAVYAKTHAVLKDTAESWDQWTEDAKTGYSHYRTKRVLRIDFQRSSEALWEASHLRQRADRQHLDEVPDPHNTVAFKFRITARLKSGRVVSVMQRSVTRRYQQDGRVVVVWRSLLEGEGDFAGLHADNTGWDELSRSANGTTLRAYIHHVPMRVQALATRQPAMKEFNGVVLDSVSKVGVDIERRFKQLQIAQA